MKGFVCTIPKSGTYLIAEFLKQVGMRATNLHLDLHRFGDYGAADLETGRRFPERILVAEPLEDSIKRICDGEFAVGHLPVSAAPLFRDFGVIFSRRNIRDVLISYCRFTADTGRCADGGAWRQLPDGPAKLLGFLEHHRGNMQSIIGVAVDWRFEKDATQISFEEMMGDFGSAATAAALRRIVRTVGKDSSTDAELLRILSRVKSTRTLTSSGRRSVRHLFWNRDVEWEYRRLGFAEINAELGYDEPRSVTWSVVKSYLTRLSAQNYWPRPALQKPKVPTPGLKRRALGTSSVAR